MEWQMSSQTEAVWLAADRLAARGQATTLAAVRKELGGGSYSTLTDAMQVWRERQAEKTLKPREPLPPDLEKLWKSLLLDLWHAAVDAANDRLQAERELFEKRQATSKHEQEEIAEFARQTSAELEESQRARVELQAELKESRVQMASLRDEANKASERLASMSARVAESEKRIFDLNEELQRVNAMNTELVRSLAEQRTSRLPTKSDK